MGMDQKVVFPGAQVPLWSTVSDLLSRHGMAVQVRMINGELAFPDEVPPEPWQELRLDTGRGMVTVRREPGQVTLVIWGNAAGPLLQAWNMLTWAFAEAGAGQILSGADFLSAAEFRQLSDLPTR